VDDPLVALLSAAEYGPRDASTESRIHDRKLGHVTCGFSGHGVNSNYFEYQCRLPHFVTIVRLHTGGAYSDGEECAETIRQIVAWLGEVAAAVIEHKVECEVWYDGLNLGETSRLCAVRTSVAAVKLPLLTDADCAAALALIRSCARRERERDG
jgi:hypothetical protein